MPLKMSKSIIGKKTAFHKLKNSVVFAENCRLKLTLLELTHLYVFGTFLTAVSLRVWMEDISLVMK